MAEKDDRQLPAVPETFGDLVGAGLTVEKVKARRNAIVRIMKECMKDGTHYGVIPGCGDKPTLLKDGADLLCNLFGLKPTHTQEVHTEGGFIRVNTTCTLSTFSGLEVGEGIGTASTGETKWLWKKAYDDEYERTEEDRRRSFWVVNDKTGNRWMKKQVMQEANDALNTVTQMSAKRAKVQAVRATLACGDIFATDLEDLVDEDHAGASTDPADDGPGKDPTGPENEPKEPAPPKKNGNGGGHDGGQSSGPLEVWRGKIQRVNASPFTYTNSETKKQEKATKFYVHGDDKTQFQTIKEVLGQRATQLQNCSVEVTYRVDRYGNNLVSVKEV